LPGPWRVRLIAKTMHDRYIILTGPTRTGKTTALRAWAESRTVAGFLSPDGPHGRQLMNVSTGELRAFEAEGDAEAAGCQIIGRFHLLQSAFDAGAAWIREGLRLGAPWLLMDEVGPLELSGTGFDTLLRETLDELKGRNTISRLLIVVRTQALDAVVSRYGLQGARKISKDQLEQLNAS